MQLAHILGVRVAIHPLPNNRQMDASGQQAVDMADPSITLPELTPQQVFEVISAAVGLDQTPRRAAETTLKGWEGDAAPGLFGSLLKIVQETSIDEVRCNEGVHLCGCT